MQKQVMAWYDANARDLPWRRPEATAWSVMVSEFMLQQTPVIRVLPAHQAWLERWPTPADLATESPGAAVRAWGRLGYPRRALRLHAAAQVIVTRFDGEVPTRYADLRELPGVGDYTAAAITAFAHGNRAVVLDTNIRRVLGRAFSGVEFPTASISAAERALAESLLPPTGSAAATWSVAVMELGALVCTATDPRCVECPLASGCAWLAAGRPAYDGPPRRTQAWTGTDRQCRGRLLATLREAEGPVHRSRLDRSWPEPAQRQRCLTSLVDDGLAVEVTPGTFALP